MTKYILETRKYGSSHYKIPIAVTDSKAKKLKKEGVEVFNTRAEALEEVKK